VWTLPDTIADSREDSREEIPRGESHHHTTTTEGVAASQGGRAVVRETPRATLTTEQRPLPGPEPGVEPVTDRGEPAFLCRACGQTLVTARQQARGICGPCWMKALRTEEARVS
jgi:hypothetical protein